MTFDIKKSELKEYYGICAKSTDVQDYEFFKRPLVKSGIEPPPFSSTKKRPKTLRDMLNDGAFRARAVKATESLAKQVGDFELTDKELKFLFAKMVAYSYALPCNKVIVNLMFFRALGIEYTRMKRTLSGATSPVTQKTVKEFREILKKFANVNYDNI